MERQALRIVIRKADRSLNLCRGDETIASYRIALGREPVGDKMCEGDGKTPEGKFFISARNSESRYHLSLAISYPDVRAANRALAEHLISTSEFNLIVEAERNGSLPPQKTSLGGEIYIHGGGSQTDWTQGCVAVSNDDIEKIFLAVDVGCSVEILP